MATPLWVSAADRAWLVRTQGVVLRNGGQISDSSAIFNGDLLETKAGSGADISAEGITVIVLPDSLVKFEEQTISLEHGSVRVATFHGEGVRVRCMSIVPVISAETHFEVIDRDGTIKVAATKNDVRLETLINSNPRKEKSAAHADILHEGLETTRYESDSCEPQRAKKETGAAPAGETSILSSEWAKWVAVAGIGGAGVFLTLQHDDPASPFIPLAIHRSVNPRLVVFGSREKVSSAPQVLLGFRFPFSRMSRAARNRRKERRNTRA